MITRRSRHLMPLGALFALLSLLLLACEAQVEPTAGPAPTVEPESLLPSDAEATPTAIFPGETATETPAATMAPTQTPVQEATTEQTGRFVTLFPTFSMVEQREVLLGVARAGDGYELVTDPLLDTVPIHNIDYAPATHRLLAWEWSGEGAGPGSVAAGALSILDLESGTRETVVEAGVVEAQWAPDGRSFAYLAATPETYELRWRPDGGEERTLARDVVRTFSIGPAGERVAFTRETGYEVPGPPGLYVVEVSSGAEVRLSPVDRAGLGGSGRPWAPMWAADGSSVLLLVNSEDGDTLVWAAGDGSWEHTLTTAALEEAVTAATGSEDPWCVDMRPLFDGTTLVTGAMACGDPTALGLPPATHLARLTLDPESGDVAETELFPLGEMAGQATLVGWAETGESVLVYWNEANEIRALRLR